jgi:hypothetical protein
MRLFEFLRDYLLSQDAMLAVAAVAVIGIGWVWRTSTWITLHKAIVTLEVVLFATCLVYTVWVYSKEIPKPSVRIEDITRDPPLIGKPATLSLHYMNDSTTSLDVVHCYVLAMYPNLPTEMEKEIEREEQLWNSVSKGACEQRIVPTAVPPGMNIMVPLRQSVLEKTHVEKLKNDKPSALYFAGMIKFSDPSGDSARVEFCGFFIADSRSQTICKKHNGYQLIIMKEPEVNQWLPLLLAFNFIVLVASAGWAHAHRLLPSHEPLHVSKLRLEFRNGDNRFLVKSSHTDHLSTGMKYSGLIAVHNDSVNPIDQVRIVIDGIFPSRFGTRNFIVKRDATDGVVISIAPRDRQFIPIFEFFDAPPFHNECLLHVACEVANPGTGEEFLLKMRVTGRTIPEPARISLRFGFHNDEFFMQQR